MFQAAGTAPGATVTVGIATMAVEAGAPGATSAGTNRNDDELYFGRDEVRRKKVRSGGARPSITPKAPARVALTTPYEPGTVVIDQSARKLYLITSKHHAYRYPISVGREGFSWTGTQKVSRIAAWPDWYPPKEMREREPSLPEKMTGGVNNPLGAKAIYLGKTLYRIHGTNNPKSIGRAASSGCFRMMNAPRFASGRPDRRRDPKCTY